MLGSYRYELDGAGQRVAVTETLTSIRYAYDPLGRLTDAQYADGRRFQYAYDAAGNRTQATQTITQTTVTNYTYDTAQRLTAVNGQPHTWDQAGRLLDDGQQQYSYDQSDRLLAVTAPGLAWRAGYDGDGVRRWQVANGAAITYTLDLAAPLVTVLAERRAGNQTTYVYGRGDSPLAGEDGSGWRYLTGRDALTACARRRMPRGRCWRCGASTPTACRWRGMAGSPTATAGSGGTPRPELVYLRRATCGRSWGCSPAAIPGRGTCAGRARSTGYAYALGNPLRFSDAGGRCPSPPVEMGPTICFSLFIKPASIGLPLRTGTLLDQLNPVVLHGDGRDFSSNSDPARSRGYMWIKLDASTAELHVNPTGYIADSW